MAGISLRSDNVRGCAPEILDALARVNHGAQRSYGADEVTARLRERVSHVFEAEVDIFPVITGSAANGLSLGALAGPGSAVLCHRYAHIVRDEFGGPEFFTRGARLHLIDGPAGKIPASGVRPALSELEGAVRPACLSVTQATEAGTCYSLEELRAVTSEAKSAGLAVHMDGARFANAVAALGCRPAELSWRSGVDVLSLGATKDGAMGAELIVVFRRDLADAVAECRQRGAHVPSKQRFLSAQLEAWLEGDLWLHLAHHANAQARRLERAIAGIDGLRIVAPVDINMVFVQLPSGVAEAMRARGHVFGDWPALGERVVRLVTSFETTSAEVDVFAGELACAMMPAVPTREVS